ncbi:MAG: hypothetical protein RLZZ219_787 [Cyanobacteriota bacterium]|jgi:pimeloyl-[acyl-carrier protein] methyl ester esterase
MTGGAERSPTAVIALHGWGGEASSWRAWVAPIAQRGWELACAERGYGGQPPQLPGWDPGSERRIVIAHSLGAHLLPEALWQQATDAVLLAGFASFLPSGRAGRALSAALRGMATQLEAGEAETSAMLREFFTRAAAPFPPAAESMELLQRGIPPQGRRRLLHDLEILATSAGLPPGLPPHIPVLLVEATDDRIVDAASRTALREALPRATVWPLERAGHSLRGAAGLPAAVLQWLADDPH